MSTQTDERPQDQGEDQTGELDQHSPEPEVVQPAEADDYTQAVELRSPRGALTLRPGQVHLDENQKAALLAIGIDTKSDPGVVPHIRPFMHMCQVRGLDPFMREAYLIGRGKGDKRKWTMQVGIDGYRKMAGATGRFIRVKSVKWTGRDDDDRSWVKDVDDDGDVVMRRVWWDFWPDEGRGNPGAAKVVIEHYDEYGNVTTTSAVANWNMYAPYVDVWDYDPHKGKRAPVIDPETGKTMQELNDMWTKGGPHMLAKCSEALAHRKAFPGAMSGVYVHEEMHRLDQVERNRQMAEQRDKRRAAYEAAQAPQALPAQSAQPAATQTVPGETVPSESAPLFLNEPAPVADVVPQAVRQVRERAEAAQQTAQQTAQPPAQHDGERAPQAPTERSSAPTERAVSDAERAQWIRDEMVMLAGVYGKPVKALYQRQVRALRKNADDFTLDELRRTVAGLRKGAPAALRRAGREDQAIAYTKALEAGVSEAPLSELLGQDGAPPPPADVDPHQPHAFVNAGGVCAVCELFEDDARHAA
jgi:hypothetical protein